jgi:hypothetical protein
MILKSGTDWTNLQDWSNLFNYMQNFQSLCRFVVIIATLLTGISLVEAQNIPRWSAPQRIPGHGDMIWTPFVVADQSQTVHAIVSDWVNESDPRLAIVYSQWRLDRGWSMPVDILLPPSGEARVHGVFLDEEGILHLIFFGGDDRRANIYYSRAPVNDADRAPAWSVPVAIGNRAITPDDATLAGDGRGNLYVVYSGNREGHGLYAVYSLDGGSTWSEPEAMFLAYSQQKWPIALRSHVDSQSNVHVAWSVADTTGNSEAVYYTRLDVVSQRWKDPIVLAEAIGFEADTPAIIEYENELIVIYHNDSPTTRWMKRSFDGGDTWTEPVRLFEHVGTNGAASLVIDGDNVLHMFFGNRVGPHPATHGMWHSIWRNGQWSEPQAIVSGPSGPSFDPARASAVVSQGNTILVAWTQEPGRPERNGAWFSFLNLDIPMTPVVTMPASAVSSDSDSSTRTPAISVTPTPRVVPLIQDDDSATLLLETNPATPIAVGVLPALMLLLVALTLKRFAYAIGGRP